MNIRKSTGITSCPAASSKVPDIVVAIVVILKGGVGTSGTIQKDCDNSKAGCQ
jgi:hypothetical protein